MDFTKLDSNYPATNDPCDDKPPWSNQCAIRMSISLNGEGSHPVNASTYTEPKCSHERARGAESLANWLWTNYRPAFKYTPAKAEGKIKTKQGIVFIKNCFTRTGETEKNGDHIDLWDKTKMKTQPTDLFLEGEEVWFFTV
jgi:hypothetical protein